MPQKPRRRLTRRNAPTRPTYPGAPGESQVAVAGGTSTATTGTPSTSARRTAEASRPAAYVARQTPYLRSEMRRVTVVSVVCFGMLAVLALVDRFQ